MARKSKIEAEKQADGNTRAKPKAIAAAPKPKRKKAAPMKKPVRAIGRAAPQKSSSIASIHEPSDGEIRIRAYFIAERRIQLSLQGDTAHDWIEARRQLVEEANRTAS